MNIKQFINRLKNYSIFFKPFPKKNLFLYKQ
nr:MAG TPA_asm: hypothetical protein [Caudoviricetes sp.]DAS69768.1 MAG TPA: hypothetical protein [Caudoviricetes sp.]